MPFLAFLVLMSSTALHAALPAELGGTGLDEAKAIAFTPRHALWSDGTDKRRWLQLPAGTAIDTTDPDAWEFPRGARFWKEFSYGGKRIETRYIERLADGSWRYATYVWNAEGTRATLAPEEGAAGPRYPIPSRADCLACHEAAPVPILGYSAVQLSSVIQARNDAERSALGYLHGNCGHCHNDSGPLAALGLSLSQSAAAPRASAKRTLRSLEGRLPELLRRLRSANAYVRMPPLGVTLLDSEGLALVEQWISQSKELSP